MKISENKRIIQIWLLRFVLIVLLLVELSVERRAILFMNLLVFGVSFLPSILKRFFSISLPFRFEVLFLCLLIFAVSFEKFFTGIIIEFILGMVYGIVGFIIMTIIYINSRIKINYSLIMLFSFSFSVALGAIWEVFRFTLIVFFNFNFGEMTEYATMIGLLLTIAGAVCILACIYVYTRFFHGSFFMNVADDVIRSNPNLFSLADVQGKDVKEIIKRGENEQVEFKATLRTNIHTGNIDKNIEFAVLKTMVAFLNTNGGTLLIGVRDNGCIEGIEQDGFATHDLLYRHFSNLFKKHIGKEYMSYMKSMIKNVDGKHVLVVECAVSQENVFMRYEDKDYFFIRTGPSSILLEGRDLVSYIKKRF